MHIINVIESVQGSITHITSFCIINENSVESVTENAVKKFKSILNAKYIIPEEVMKCHVEDGFFEDIDSGYVLSMTLSDEVY